MAHFALATGAILCAVSVIAGAFGAHALKTRLDPAALALWETAARYLIYGGFGLLAIGLTSLHKTARGLDLAAICLLVGSFVFSGTVAALALGSPRWLGAVTPLGGAAMILGFVLFAVAAMKL